MILAVYSKKKGAAERKFFMHERLQKIKEVLQSTYFYTIYLFFVRNFRKAKKGFKKMRKNLKRSWRRTIDPLYKNWAFTKSMQKRPWTKKRSCSSNCGCRS